MSTPPTPRRFTFTRAMRLHGNPAFAAVYNAKVKKNLGPLTFFSKPNALNHPRLGLSVPRRVGTAPVRNKIKRYVREAFRLAQHDWPEGYDIIVVVRPHEPAALGDYQRHLLGAIRSLHIEWQRRSRREAAAPIPDSPSAPPAPAPAPPSETSREP